MSNPKPGRLYVCRCHPLANGFFSVQGLVAYKRPFRVVGAERQESFIVALGDRRVCRFSNCFIVL
nr:hypothetical protein [Oculatella sp. FACHB-28]